MGKTRRFAVAVCVAAVVGVGATGALAGEIKGPPYQGDPVSGGIATPENSTGAAAHARSDCSFSGLNDYDSDLGQNTRQTQTPKDGPFPGSPGLGFQVGPNTWISCRGNGTHK